MREEWLFSATECIYTACPGLTKLKLSLCMPRMLEWYLWSKFDIKGKVKNFTGIVKFSIVTWFKEFLFVEKTITVEPRFTNAPVHEQFGSWVNFPTKNRLGWRTVSRITNGVSDYERCLGLRTCKLVTVASWQQRQAGNSDKLRVSARECQSLVN
jgi:hypothetical protein